MAVALRNLFANLMPGLLKCRREQLKRVEQGQDPVNTVRERAQNRRIPTHAWNTILSPAEAAQGLGDGV